MESLRQIKHEIEEQGYEIDIARGRFETALQELVNKGDLTESDRESNADEKEKLQPESEDTCFDVVPNNGYAILPSRPFKKKRRKDTENKDCGFHHTFVMRMFDRSVDLAQFGDSSPLYPICRAWMLNRPHKSELIQNNKGEYDSLHVDKIAGDILEVDETDEKPMPITFLPEPDPWPENIFRSDPRIPDPPPAPSTKKLDGVNKEVHISPALLLTQHLHRWKNIRNEWKAIGMEADNRYHKTFNLLKIMFDGQSA